MFRPQSVILLLAISLVAVSCGSTKSAATMALPSTTTMECTQITGDGNYIIEVQSRGRNIEKATESALKDVVKGVLFEGITGSSINRIQTQKPLVQDADVRLEKQDYFQHFFNSGDYRLYVEALPNIPPRVVKVVGGYKVKVSVILKKQLLRRRLENDGVIKSLGSSFN